MVIVYFIKSAAFNTDAICKPIQYNTVITFRLVEYRSIQ